jgi:SAM-dependent methyltransferase
MLTFKHILKKSRNSARKMKTRLGDLSFSLVNRFQGPRGVNLGGGKWRKLGWVNYDNRHEDENSTQVTLGTSSRLAFADASLDYVFTSHFFEHIDDDTALNLMREANRVLRPGGLFRISVPDFEKTLERYRAGDSAFFDDVWGHAPRYENWLEHGIQPTLENKLSYAFFGYANMPDRDLFPPWRHIPGYYCGPVDLHGEEVKSKAHSMDIHAFSDWLLSYTPKKYFDLGHINCYDLGKFRAMLGEAGFSHIERSTYRGSVAEELRGPEFDNRPEMSLFVEARK